MSVFSRRTRVRFQDVDAAGIVFFARVFDLFHDTYLEWLAAAGVDVPRALRERTWGAPLVHAEADYAAPLRYGDEIDVVLEAIEEGKTSILVRYRIEGAATGDRRATGATKHVFVSMPDARPRGVPDEVRRALPRGS